MINVAICDDDKPFTEIVKQLLQRTAAEQGAEICCDIFFNGSSLIRAVTNQQSCYDLIYLDIEMANMDGVHTALALRDMEFPTLIVYISGHEERLQDLFCVTPFRFLSKPVDEKAFRIVFYEAYKEIGKRDGYFNFFYKKARYRIPLSWIIYFESRDRVITIHLAGKNTERAFPRQNQFYAKMNEVEKLVASMNGRFLRIHQSFLVNYDYIKMLSASEVEMLNGTRIQISEDRRKKVRERFAALTNVKEGIK